MCLQLPITVFWCPLISKHWNVLSPLFTANPVSIVVTLEQHIQFALLNSIKSPQNRHDMCFRWITDKCKSREITFCSFSEPVLLAGRPPPNLTRTHNCWKSLSTKPWAHSSVGLCYPYLSWKNMLKNSSATRPSRAASHLPVLSKNILTPQILHFTWFMPAAKGGCTRLSLCRVNLSSLQNTEQINLHEELKFLAQHFWREGRPLQGLRQISQCHLYRVFIYCLKKQFITLCLIFSSVISSVH